MKILLVHNKYLPIYNKDRRGAIEQLLRTYIEYNESQNDKFTIYSPKIAKDNYDSKELKNVAFRIIDFTKFRNKALRLLHAIKRRVIRSSNNEFYIREVINDIKRRHEENTYDLIIFENEEKSIPLFRKKTATKTRIALHLHNDYVNIDEKDSMHILNNCDEVWCVSKFIKSRVKEVKDIKTVVIPNTVANFPEPDKKEVARLQKLYNPNQNKIFLYIGRLLESKGINELIDAFNVYNNENKDAKLIIIGDFDGNYKGKGFEKAIRFKISSNPNIDAIGFKRRQEIANYYRIAHTQIIPSKCNEAFGLVTLEAMLGRVAIIASDQGALREICGDKAMYISSKNMVQDLVNAMRQSTFLGPITNNYYDKIINEYSSYKFINSFSRAIHGCNREKLKKQIKIGVITFHKSENYGAYLQCFALQKALKDMGYAPSVINYETAADIERYKLISAKSPKKFIKSLILYIPNKKRSKSFKEAQKRYNLSTKNELFDVAITGSDQVWNPNLSGGTIDPYFTLKKINAKKKISYAASIGNEGSVSKFTNTFKIITTNLDSISVREEKAKEELSKLTKNNIKVTVDPTALIKKDTWLKLIEYIPVDKTTYIFSYFIGIRKDQARTLAKICKNLNLKTLSFSQVPKEKHIYKYCYTEGPFKFLARLRDAKLVITSSFHGTILSIILHKNFYVLMPDPKKRSRMDNILKLTGLTNRIIETESDIEKINLDDIDYSEPQKKLDKLRKESLDWLKDAIEN